MKIGRRKRANILIPLLELPGIVKFQETESKIEVTRAQWSGEGDGEFMLDGYGALERW